MGRFALLGAVAVLALAAGPVAALTAVVEVNEDLYYTQNRSSFYGNTSLTNFYAPLPVFFEGWKSSPRDDIVSYSWDFGDGSPAMSGFNAAHVYETPGTYTARLTVTDKNGQTASATRSITVRTRDGQTYYVDAVSGNDSNSGLSPQQAWRTATHAFDGLAQATPRYNPGDQILFRRGQTFQWTGHVQIGHNKRYGYMFATYGEGARPIIQYMGGAAGNSLFSQGGRGLAHVSFVELDFRCTTPDGSQTASLWYSTGDMFNMLFLRIHAQDFSAGLVFSHGMDEKRLSGCFIVDSTTYNSQGVHIYTHAVRFALLNNHLDLSGNHLCYGAYMDKGVIQGNLFTRAPAGRTSLRVAGTAGFNNPSNNIWIENNYMTGWVDPVTVGVAHGDGVRYNGIIMHMGPNSVAQQGMHDLVFQNNTVVDGEKLIGLGSYERVRIRNNLLWTHSPWGEGHIYFSSHQNFDQRPMKDIQIYDNLIIKDPASDSGTARMLEIRPYTGPAYPGRTNHEDLLFRNNRMVWTSGRGIWFENMDMNLVNGFTSNQNRYYTSAPNQLAARSGTLYDLTGWRSLSGNDMQSSVQGTNMLPGTGTASSPPSVDSGAITVTYSGATDRSGTGVKQVHLWARKDRGSWIRTGLTRSGASGSIAFTPTRGNGTYYFWVQTEDNAGNFSLPKTVPSPYPHMSGKRTLSPYGDAATVYGGGVHSPPPPPLPDPDPDPEPPPPADTTPPSPGTLTAPASTMTSPITVSYTGAADNTGGSGLDRVLLYARKDGGTWAYTGLDATGASGSFAYPAPGAGAYNFALVAIDKAGNQSTAPSGTGMGSTVFTLPPPPSEGLVSHLRFDDSPADGAQDSARPGVMAPVSGGVSLTSGRLDGAYAFDDGFVDLGNMDIPGAGLTLSAWINPSHYIDWSRDGRIVGKATGLEVNDHWWMLNTIRETDTNTRVRFRLKTQGSTTSTLIGASGDIPVNTWTHIAATFDGINMRVYLNGELNGTLGKVGTIAQNPTVPVGVGKSPGSNNKPWAGRIDDVRIYNYALSASEIQAIMDPATPPPSADTAPPAPGTLTAPASASSAPITVQFSGAADEPGGSGLAQVRLFYRIGGGAWADSGLTSTAGSGSFQFNAVSVDGPYHFHTVATDNAGNSSAAPSGNGMATTFYDANGPVLGSLTAAVSLTNSGPVSFNYTGFSDASGVASVALWVRPPGGVWAATGQASSSSPSGSLSFNAFTGDGVYRFALVAADTLGNVTSAASGNGMASVQYDTTPPTVGTMGGPATASGSGAITLSYSGVTDTGGVASVQLWVRPPNGSWTNTGMQSAAAPSGAFSFGNFTNGGQYNFGIRAIDLAGNASPTPSGNGLLQVTYEVPAPETASLTSPQYANSTPIQVAYTTTSTAQVKEVRLRYRRSQDSLWSDSGLLRNTASGSFPFAAVVGNATYHFALLITDVNGTSSPEPAPGSAGLATTIYDTTPPNPGSLSAPTVKGEGPLVIQYSGVTDTGGSTVDLITLWRRPPGGTWASTGITSTVAPASSFEFNNFSAEGAYNFALRVRDKAGNLTPVPTGQGALTYQHDTTPPTLPTLALEPYFSSLPITVSYAGASDAGSGLSQVELWARPDGQAWSNTGLVSTTASGAFSFNAVGEDGTYAFGVRARDVAGNATPAPSGVGLAQTVLDRLQPQPASLTVAQYSKSSPVAVSYTNATDAGSGLARVRLWARKGFEAWQETGVTATTAAGTLSYDGLSGDGTYHFYAQVEDRAGNRSPNPTGVGNATTQYDSTPPTTGVLSAVEAEVNASPIELSYSGVVETGSGLDTVTLFVRRGTGAWQSAGLTANTVSGFFSYHAGDDGAYHFDLRTRDKAGNESPMPAGTGQVTVQLDGTPPTVGPLTAPEYANSNPVTIEYSGVTDGDGGSGLEEVELYVRRNTGGWVQTGEKRSEASGSIDYTITTGDGTYQFALRAEDKAGNRSPVPTGNGTAQTVFDTTRPTPGVATAPAYTNNATIPVAYSGAQDAGSGLDNVALWVSIDGGPWAFASGHTSEGASGSFAFTAEQSGRYAFALRARDKAGNRSHQPVSADATTIYDSEPPALGTLEAPAQDDSPPISVLYSGVTDSGGSGLATVHLWVRKGGGPWQDAGLVSDKASGAFAFHGMTGNDTYYFALVAADRAGNRTPAPTGDGMGQTAYNSDFTAGSAQSPEFTNELPIVVSYDGAQDSLKGGEMFVMLWVKRGNDGEWVNTGLQEMGASGSFEFDDVEADGVFHFAVQAKNASDDLSSPPFGNGSTTTVYDTIPPTALAWSSPATTNTLPIVVDFTGIQDAGSGVRRALLWVRQGVAGEWEQLDLDADSSEGEFLFTGDLTDDEYFFYIQAEDNAGNRSPRPDEPKEDALEATGTPLVLLESPGILQSDVPLEAIVTISEPGGMYLLVIEATGTPLDGVAPQLRLSVNGTPQSVSQSIGAITLSEYVFPIALEPAVYDLGVVLINAASGETEARTVLIETMVLQALSESPVPLIGAVEAEKEAEVADLDEE